MKRQKTYHVYLAALKKYEQKLNKPAKKKAAK
jgi:hypothetical protein